MKLYPEIELLKRDVTKLSKLARMSGSGSTFFIPVFKENERKIIKKIAKLPYNVLKTQVKR